MYLRQYPTFEELDDLFGISESYANKLYHRHRDILVGALRLRTKLCIPIEHVNRQCKIFRAVKETYRGKHAHYHKIWTVVAALVNLRYASETP